MLSRSGTVMSRWWRVWKHALGAFDEEDGYNVMDENAIAVIRSLIVVLNLLCGILIMINILKDW
jgi:hypothetical protein|tara:strand:- start:1993 stop:2184 length:192 start_codon:yes stop_codon:yes gene_type:complete